MKYDLIVIGSGPGGYVAAIRASQLGMSVAVVEKESLGGVCLNWGCIPTKALLKSAEVFHYLNHASDYGFTTSDFSVDFPKIIERSRGVANKMSGGVSFLMKKNNIQVFQGIAKLLPGKKVEITGKTEKNTIEANHIILATGARSRELPNIPQEGKSVISYREALSLNKLPKRMLIIGSGAIGCEFAYFYSSLGTEVTLVEYLDRIVANEDAEISDFMEKSFKKKKIKVLTNSSVEKVKIKEKGEVIVTIKNIKTQAEEKYETDIVLSAVGIVPNTENLGLETIGIKIAKDGKVEVDEWNKTNIEGYYAIGDITKGPALAHVASAEGILCVEKIAGLNVMPIDYSNIPGCTYTMPEIASVGFTEKQAIEFGHEILVGKFPFSASGKATANGDTEGFVKVIFSKKYGEWLGCHMVGKGVTELISEAVVARKLETTGHEILKSVHPHPTLSEVVMEAVAAAYGEVIHL
jgi:dihydrolipoamide dehydrogenase